MQTGTTQIINTQHHLIVLVNEVQATIVRHESSNLLAVLNQLDANALTHGRVRLLGLNTAATENNQDQKLLNRSQLDITMIA